MAILVARQKYLYKERNTNGQTLIRKSQFSADTAVALYKVFFIYIALQMILTSVVMYVVIIIVCVYVHVYYLFIFM